VIVVVMEFCDLGSLMRAVNKKAFKPHGKWSYHTTYVSHIIALMTPSFFSLVLQWSVHSPAQTSPCCSSAQRHLGFTYMSVTGNLACFGSLHRRNDLLLNVHAHRHCIACLALQVAHVCDLAARHMDLVCLDCLTSPPLHHTCILPLGHPHIDSNNMRLTVPLVSLSLSALSPRLYFIYQSLFLTAEGIAEDGAGDSQRHGLHTQLWHHSWGPQVGQCVAEDPPGRPQGICCQGVGLWYVQISLHCMLCMLCRPLHVPACAREWLYNVHVKLEQALQSTPNRPLCTKTSQTTRKKACHDAYSIVSPRRFHAAGLVSLLCEGATGNDKHSICIEHLSFRRQQGYMFTLCLWWYILAGKCRVEQTPARE